MHTLAETKCLFLIKANLSQLLKINLNHITLHLLNHYKIFIISTQHMQSNMFENKID